MANLELAAAFGAADAAKEQDLRGYYPMAARVLADEVRRRKAERQALAELAAKTAELIEHLQKTGRLAPCFNLPALDAAQVVLREERQSAGDALGPLRRLWPLFEKATQGYVFTAERAGEVAADMAALRKALEA